jgi:hypothetical protein
MDSDTGGADGIPDYVENWHGDGRYDLHTDTETDWQNDAYQTTGVHDWNNAVYDDMDLDGDGMVGRVERALATSPLIPQRLLDLTQVITGEEPQIVTFKVPIDYSALTAIGGLNLNINGVDATLEEINPDSDGKCLIAWNTAFDPPGVHYLQAHITVDGATTDLQSSASAIDSAMGGLSMFASDNVLQFFEDGSMFDSSGAYLDAQLPENDATFTIQLYDASVTPQTLIRTIGPNTTSSGMIREDWNVTCADNVTPFTGDAVDAVFNVTLTDSGRTGSSRKRMHRPAGALSEFSPNFNFLYMYSPKSSGLATAYARGGLVWIGMQGVVDVLMQPANGYPVYQSYFDQFTCYPCTTFPGYVTSRTMVTGTLFPLMGGARQFYSYTHGSGNRLTAADSNVFISASEVGTLLGNIYRARGGLTTYNPYRFVFLDGCSTASKKDWRRAFGIYPRSAPNQAARNRVGPQAYVGWARDHTGWMNGGTGNSTKDLDLATAYATTMHEFYLTFMTGGTLRQCIDQAVQPRVNTAPFPVPTNKNVTVTGNGLSLAGHSYSWSFTTVVTSKIYVVGHSGLRIDQQGYNAADDGYYPAPSNTQ